MASNEMEQYYRERAPEYEQIYYRDNPQRRRELSDEAGRLAELVTGKRVLELACGTGYWTQVMSRTAKSVVASDLFGEMLSEARQKKYGCEVEFRQADMFTADFGQGAFDAVALGFWFSHQPRQEYDRLFDLLERPLADGGVIWMIDNNPPAEGPTLESVRVDEYRNNYKRRFLDDGTEFVILKNYFERAELEGIFGSRFSVKLLLHSPYYWSAVLGKK